MKKLILIISLIFINSSLYADYKIFVNKSVPFSDFQIQNRNVLYFGKLEDYVKDLKHIQKNIVVNGIAGMASGLSTQSVNLAKGLVGEGLKAGATGFGIGLLIGALDPYVMGIYADDYFIKVYKINLSNGKTIFMNKFLVCDKHPKLSLKEAEKILEDK